VIDLMTLDELLEIVEERGLSVTLGPDGQPRLRGPKEEATPALVEMLRLCRDDIIERLRPAHDTYQVQECRWRNGHVGTHSNPEQGWPVGAGWWRPVGETKWQPIPGREVSRGEMAPDGPLLPAEVAWPIRPASPTEFACPELVICEVDQFGTQEIVTAQRIQDDLAPGTIRWQRSWEHAWHEVQQ